MPAISIHSERTNLLNKMFRDYQQSAFSIRTQDGWSWRSSKTKEPACIIVLRTPAALRALLQEPSELALGEAFVNGDIDLEGDIFSVFPVVEHLLKLSGPLQNLGQRVFRGFISDLVRYCRQGPRHSLSRDRAAIARHYEQPTEFYRPWLGDTLAYSCAYFRDANDSLDSAQENKLELICRKLRLDEHDRFLDIGCGWGSLTLHAVRHYGAEAHGITLSRAQAAVATRRIREAGLAYRCTVDSRDYREATQIRGQFDKIASVGMFEHVGSSNLKRYFGIVFGMLKPGGLFLNHGIARAASTPSHKGSFIDRHVFPDGELVPLNQTIRLAESVGLEVRDVENLREHYAHTLRLWVEGLRRNSRSIIKTASEEAYRTWLLYMAGSACAFERGDLAVYQILFRRYRDAQCCVPVTRETWYTNWIQEQPRLSA